MTIERTADAIIVKLPTNINIEEIQRFLDYLRYKELVTEQIDTDDITFVGLSLFLDIKLWTGDKLLIGGLTKKGFKKIITTQEMLQLRREL